MCVRAVVLSLARVLGLPVYAEEEDPCGRQRTGERMDVEGEDEPKEGEEKRREGGCLVTGNDGRGWAYMNHGDKSTPD